MKKIPVTILSGFLGSGKTTLINRILQEEHTEQIAVIINEFGEISVDHQLIMDVKDDVFQMANGCLCCTLRNDIAETLQHLIVAKDKQGLQVDRVLFETTGLADPAPIAQTFINLPFLNDHFIVDSVLTIVDAQNFITETKQQSEPAKQVAFADKLFVSKRELVDDAQFQDVMETIKTLNAFAPIHVLSERPVTMKDLFDLELFYATEEKILEMAEETCPHCHHKHSHHCTHPHEHTNDCCHHAHHTHTHGITSFVIESNTPLVLQKINQWVNAVIYDYSEQLYRYKGILNVKDIPYQIILQGVQRSYDINRGRDWGPTEKKTTLVFIGKDLPEEKLRESFQMCLAD